MHPIFEKHLNRYENPAKLKGEVLVTRSEIATTILKCKMVGEEILKNIQLVF